MTSPSGLVRRLARQFGFSLVGVTTAEAFQEAQRVALQRLRQGLMEGMSWYTESRVRRGCNPQELLPGARSIISVAVSYLPEGPPARPEHAPPPPREGGGIMPQPSCYDGDPHRPQGRVARYAWGRDYHNVLKGRLRALMRALEASLGRPIRYKVYVDDGPMLDREVARRAGVGFFGKNTNILTAVGSWVFLGQVITDLELQPDAPLRKSCGRCTACIPACPTGAIIAPYVLDNTRCISYLTIENRGPIPRELRPLMGDWVFGCDLCQEVCPVNRKAVPTLEPAFQARPDSGSLELIALLEMSEAEFRQRFQGSPIRRARRVGLQRNACVALGNLGDPRAAPALARALREAEPLVRGHAAWALGRIGGQEARLALQKAWATEQDAWVREEIGLALASQSIPAAS